MTLLAPPLGFATSSVWPLFQLTLSLNEFRGSRFHQLQAIFQTSHVRHDCVSVASGKSDRHAHTELRNTAHLSTHERSGFRGENISFGRIHLYVAFLKQELQLYDV